MTHCEGVQNYIFYKSRYHELYKVPLDMKLACPSLSRTGTGRAEPILHQDIFPRQYVCTLLVHRFSYISFLFSNFLDFIWTQLLLVNYNFDEDD